jgi:hypothetical protein
MNPGTQSFVSYDSASGMFTFMPGTYKIDAYSITAFGYMMNKATRDSVHSAPGYAYLCNADSNSIVILGSMQDPVYALPSILQDVISVTKPTKFYLGHQNGDSVLNRGVKLETADTTVTKSINHAMANIVIEKLADSATVASKSIAPCSPPPPPH